MFDELVGKKVTVIYRDNEEDRPITGIFIGTKEGLIIIETFKGKEYINIKSIVRLKPTTGGSNG